MLVIIQARLSSKRLPGKVLKKINGVEIIKHIIRNLNYVKYNLNIVVATSNNKSDKKLVNFLKKNNITYFCNSLNNVLIRLLKCALKHKAKYFIRINGDSPFIDYRIVEKLITFFNKNSSKYDLITNVFPRTFPSGQSVEIIKTSCLEKISKKKLLDRHKEHATKFMYENNKFFKIKNIKNIKNLSNYSLSVDTKEEFILYKKRLKRNLLSKNYTFQKILNIIYK